MPESGSVPVLIWPNGLCDAVPGAPRILARESTVMNNTITFVWEAHRGGGDVSGYVLELDDGSTGQFRVRRLI